MLLEIDLELPPVTLNHHAGVELELPAWKMWT